MEYGLRRDAAATRCGASCNRQACFAFLRELCGLAVKILLVDFSYVVIVSEREDFVLP